MRKTIKFLLLCVLGMVISMGTNVMANNKYYIAGGSWSELENGFTCENLGYGDCFLLLDKYVDGTKSFVFECDAKFTGNAIGIVFGAKNIDNPSESWYCLNLQKHDNNSRAFFVRGSLEWNITTGIPAEIFNRDTNRLKVVFVAGESISFFVDEFSIGSYPTKNFAGGYLGVMTCYANAFFTNIGYREFVPDKISNFEFINFDFDSKFQHGKTEYLSYVNYAIDEFKFKVDFPESITITAEGEDGIVNYIRSGQECNIPLQVGYNKITINQTYKIDSNVSSTQVLYMNIHRAQKESLLYNEHYRPQTHFSSKTEWINDPNGMMYNSATGEYHLFYQTRPRTSAVDNNQCWYHAVSKDLIHWEQIEPAIEPDNLGFCWSGSGGIDKYNTSGFFDEDSDPDSRMVIIYSSVYGDTYYGVEKISLAYSKDNGRTWIKYDGNPIIRNGSDYKQQYTDGFRDPKLVWYEDSSYANGGIWLMLVGGGQGRLFSSENLVDWNFESALVGVDKKPLHGECPDFFKITVENEPGVEKWVYVSGQLDLNVNPNIFQTSAVVGRLEKNSRGKFVFTAEQDLKQVFYGGNTMYATQSFHSTADGRRIQISWLREWLEVTGVDVPDRQVKDWNGLMSWPMELKLYNVDGKYIFKSYPISEMISLRGEKLFSQKDVTVNSDSKNIFSQINSRNTEIVAKIDVTKASSLTFKLRQNGENSVNVMISDYNSATGTAKITADGTNSGKFKGNIAQVVTSAENGIITIRMVVDSNCIDVYCNEGENSVFALAYPDYDNTELSIQAQGSAKLLEVDVYELDSIWQKNVEEDKVPIKKEYNINNILIGVICGLVLVLMGGCFFLFKKKK